ncbi:MAG: ABC transporter ATP-binding protein/permease [Lachnospiraceae bacterium]|nr:ABC transporter ATP-binding protein/permease [Lachnospiraceae bacterium]
MWKLLKYLKSYRKESILAPLFKMLEATFELLIPIVMKNMVDTGIANRDTGYIVKMCLLMVLLGLIGFACSITAQYFAARAATGFAAKLRQELYRHIQSLSYREFDRIGTSTMITRMTSDINQIQTGVNLVLRLFLRSPFIVFGAMIMAFTLDVKSALIFVVTIPLLSVVVFGVMLASIPLYRKVQEALDKVVTLTRWNLNGVRVIRAFCREEAEQKEFEKENGALNHLQIVAGRVTAVMNPLTCVIVNGAIAAILWFGGTQVNIGVYETGTVIALVNYMSQILTELVKLANLIITVTKAVACGNRVQAIFEMENGLAEAEYISESEAENRSESPAVQFRHVTLTYQNAGMPSLYDIDFTAKRGQTIGIIGGTGSGKTSVVNLIPRFYDATEGEVLVDGKNVKENNPLRDLRAKIGVVPQKAVLFAGTIRDNMCWGKKDATDEEIWQALRLAQAAEFVEKKEGGLDFAITQGGRNLSGGQRQRLTIARALVKQLEILILDDSASALDYATDAALRESLKHLPGNPTVFIVSQRTSSLQSADCILVMEDGHMVGKGTHEELLKSCDIYREIHHAQFPEEGVKVS